MILRPHYKPDEMEQILAFNPGHANAKVQA